MIPKQIYLSMMVLVCCIILVSCGSARVGLNENEDDVYHSRRESRGKDVYVPEVDVDELIKKNPAQYDSTQPVKQNPIYLESAVAGVAAQNSYSSYKSSLATEEPTALTNYVINTNNYTDEPERYTESERLRLQYGDRYDNYDFYYNDFYNPYLTWNWRTLTTPLYWGLGWNNQFGWYAGVNLCYASFYDPFCFYQPWGYNPYWYNYGYCNNWYWATPVCNTNQNQVTVQARRTGFNSSLPLQSAQISNNPEAGKVIPNTSRKPVPSNQAQLITENGKTVYVAPEQYRKSPPRSYSTYQKSVDNEVATRAVTPPPSQRNNTMPRSESNYQSSTSNRNNPNTVNTNQRRDVPNSSNTYRNNTVNNSNTTNTNRSSQNNRTYSAPPAGNRGGTSSGGGSSRTNVARPR